MRDTIQTDEASFYFRDPTFDRPRFPRVSSAATIDAASPSKRVELSLPRHFSPGAQFASMSTATGLRGVGASSSSPGDGQGKELWVEFVADDDSSCGSLDYSLDRELELEFDEVLNELDVLDKKPMNDLEECFKLPWEWVVSLFRSDNKSSKDMMLSR